MAYFDLLHMRSYKTSGKTGQIFYFRQGTPVQIDDSGDIEKFRAQPEIFKEVDLDGNLVVPVVKPSEERTYKRFRAQNIFIEDAEDLLNKVHQEAVKNPPKRDINALLQAANEDAIIPATVKDVTKEGTIMSDDLPKRPTGSAKKTKVAANACPKCSRKFKSSEELKRHLADHDGE
jgi:hypothetical protein